MILSSDQEMIRDAARDFAQSELWPHGARILVTLLYALKARGKTKGLATLCIGGGEATAMAVELV